MAWTTPRDWTDGELVTEALLDTHLRDNLLALTTWTAYTPTWATPVGLGNGTLAGRYIAAGDLCHFSLQLVFGSTTNPGTSTGWTFTLPVVAAGAAVASAYILDSGATHYNGVARINSGASTFDVTTNSSAFPLGYAVPFTWATNDVLYVSGTYEI